VAGGRRAQHNHPSAADGPLSGEVDGVPLRPGGAPQHAFHVIETDDAAWCLGRQGVSDDTAGKRGVQGPQRYDIELGFSACRS
jgi:hypothetical protein